MVWRRPGSSLASLSWPTLARGLRITTCQTPSFHVAFPLHPSLFLFRREGAEPSSDQIFDRGFSSRDDFESSNLPFAFAFGRADRPPVDVALPIGFPVPDVDVVIQLPMQKKAGASPSGSPMAAPSRNVPGVSRSFLVLSCHSSKNAISVPSCTDRTVRARCRRFRPHWSGDHLTAQRQRHRRNLVPGRVFRSRRNCAGNQVGADKHACELTIGIPNDARIKAQTINARRNGGMAERPNTHSPQSRHTEASLESADTLA